MSPEPTVLPGVHTSYGGKKLYCGGLVKQKTVSFIAKNSLHVLGSRKKSCIISSVYSGTSAICLAM